MEQIESIHLRPLFYQLNLTWITIAYTFNVNLNTCNILIEFLYLYFFILCYDFIILVKIWSDNQQWVLLLYELFFPFFSSLFQWMETYMIIISHSFIPLLVGTQKYRNTYPLLWFLTTTSSKYTKFYYSLVVLIWAFTLSYFYVCICFLDLDLLRQSDTHDYSLIDVCMQFLLLCVVYYLQTIPIVTERWYFYSSHFCRRKCSFADEDINCFIDCQRKMIAKWLIWIEEKVVACHLVCLAL